MEYSENYYSAAQREDFSKAAANLSNAYEQESRRYSRRFTEEDEAKVR